MPDAVPAAREGADGGDASASGGMSPHRFRPLEKGVILHEVTPFSGARDARENRCFYI